MKRIITVSLILIVSSCTTTLPPIELDGPFYCSPKIKIEADNKSLINHNDKYPTEYYWKDSPKSGIVTVGEIGSSIINKTPVRKDYFFLLTEKNSFEKDIYFRSRMEEELVLKNLNENQIRSIKQDNYDCSGSKINSQLIDHAKLLETYSVALKEENANLDKVRIILDNKTPLILVAEYDEGNLYKFSCSAPKSCVSNSYVWKYKEGVRVWEPEEAYGVYVPNKKDSGIVFIRNKGYGSYINGLPINFQTGIELKSEIKGNYNDVLTQQELIYNGRSGDTVKFLYREFTSEGMARAAFQQVVTYDLKIGEVIGFKGARFRILEADNINLSYEVLNHFYNPSPLTENISD
tara:strand:+ start:221 stop:1267 length:1047 start_codon:yes stop_codon:yes gene_type:complete